MSPAELKALQVSTLVNMARMTHRSARKAGPLDWFREWELGRTAAYMGAARYIDGRLFGAKMRRELGVTA